MREWFWRLCGWRRVMVIVRANHTARPYSLWTRGDVTVVCAPDGCMESIACGGAFVRFDDGPATEAGDAVRAAWTSGPASDDVPEAGAPC